MKTKLRLVKRKQKQNCDSENLVTGAGAVIDPIDQVVDIRLQLEREQLVTQVLKQTFTRCIFSPLKLLSSFFFSANLKLFLARHIS